MSNIKNIISFKSINKLLQLKMLKSNECLSNSCYETKQDIVLKTEMLCGRKWASYVN